MCCEVSVETRGDLASTAQALYRALAAGDRDSIDKLLSDDFVGHAAEGLPLNMGGEHRGAEAMRRNLWWMIGKHFKAEAQPDEFRMLDDGGLLVAGHYRGVARHSGRRLDAEFTHVLAFDGDGRISSLRQLTDTAAWVEALGSGAPLETIDYSVSDGVATVCLNRPDARNAIDLRVAEETLVVARRIADDPSVRAVLICGNGPALTVGGDIKYFLASPPSEFGNLFSHMTAPFHEAFRILSRIDAPIVTAAHGSVAGGGLGYVYAADIVLAAEGTKFVTAFAGIGLSGDGGGTWHLPRLIGPARATRAYLENRPITAEQALDWGLISEVVQADELRERAAVLAASLATGPTRAFGRMRMLLRETWHNDLSQQLLAETEGVKATGDTVDGANAIASFAAKRKPQFEGR
jgi:2-(1,2-epoxy-1,2-dihydrophenyl)acetyl-CoA isomerase